MKKINYKEVIDIVDSGKDYTIVNVLQAKSFDKEHIDCSINIPINDPDFDKLVELNIPDKNSPVIVHCSGYSCSASTTATKKIEAMGYKKVYDFKGGIEEWRKAGLRLVEKEDEIECLVCYPKNRCCCGI